MKPENFGSAQFGLLQIISYRFGFYMIANRMLPVSVLNHIFFSSA